MSENKRDYYSIFLSVISLALAALVVLLVLQNRGLKADVGELRGQLQEAASQRGGLAVGDQLQQFSLVNANGAPVEINVADGRPRLLLAFTSTCPHCKDAFPIWRDLLRDHGAGFEVLGVQLDAGPGGAARLDTLPFPVLVPGDAAPPFLREITGVPATILVDGSGKVEKVSYGAPDEEATEELQVALVKARARP